jgi:hypothetical protein
MSSITPCVSFAQLRTENILSSFVSRFVRTTLRAELIIYHATCHLVASSSDSGGQGLMSRGGVVRAESSRLNLKIVASSGVLYSVSKDWELLTEVCNGYGPL